ncbi:MAG TPA: CHAT domain-containing tetratricopeptide repeat protein [Pyrinomonadaceae bacterium]|jgi:CHAT domain-containing protein|nr:CHAT domain-containing tetratricopeptide repeat protein [Pyrinomonadaceae bacterium]
MRRVRKILTGLLAAVCVVISTSGNVPVTNGTPPHTTAQSTPKSASAERQQGRNLLRVGKAAEALIHLERARKAFHDSGDTTGEASTLDLLGELYERQGQYDFALKNYRAALELYTAAAAGKSKPKASSMLPGQAGKAAAKAAKGADAAVALSNEQRGYNAVLMLTKIGNMRDRRGDTAGARAEFMSIGVEKPEMSALAKASQGGGILGSALRGFSTDDKGNLGFNLGVGTLSGLFAAKTQIGLYRQSIIYAGKEIGLGRLDLKDSQFDSARKHFEDALDATKGSLPLVGKLGQSRRFRTAARTGLGDVAFEQGRYKDAAKLYEEAYKGAKSDGRLDLMWPAQRGEGRSLWKLAAAEKEKKKAGKLRVDALDSYREALATIDKIREGSVRADESRTIFLATTRDVFEEAAGALAEMSIAEANPAATDAPDAPATTQPLQGQALAYASEALKIAERGRARSLLDMLSDAGGEITGGVPLGLRDKKRANLQRQQELAALLTGVSLGEDISKDKIEDTEKELADLQSAYESIENEIGAANPAYAALTSPSTLSAEEIQDQVLDERTALLEYSLGAEHSYLFAVTPAGVTVSRLPARGEVERQVTAFRKLLVPASVRRSITDLVANAVDAERGLRLRSAPPKKPSPEFVNAYAQAAHALYKSTVEPAAPLFKDRRLLVVADGALNYVPFDAMLTSAPAQGADFSTLPYLIKTNETVFAPSASVVAAIRARARGAGASGDMLVVADPVFHPSDSRAHTAAVPPQPDAQAGQGGPSFDSALADIEDDATSAGTSAQRGVLVRLPGTGEEAHEIEKLASASGLKADLLLDLNASESNVEGRDLSRYRVLHFATHGLLDAERPQFTGVVLSLVGNPEGSDGFLRTDEVFNLKLSSPLVMLSACETGLGRERRGEGVMGLSRAFMYAGAPTVGVTLWSVADKSTAELMADFYKNLLGSSTPAPSDAMRRARLHMIEGGLFSTPYNWAPFVLVGDWR